MFDPEPSDSVKVKTKRKTRKSRASMNAKRRAPEVMKITIHPEDPRDDAWSCEVIKPVHPRGRLWVSCEPETLARVLTYIIEKGFTAESMNHHTKGRECT